jgi:hypothetical protein
MSLITSKKTITRFTGVPVCRCPICETSRAARLIEALRLKYGDVSTVWGIR